MRRWLVSMEFLILKKVSVMFLPEYKTDINKLL